MPLLTRRYAPTDAPLCPYQGGLSQHPAAVAPSTRNRSTETPTQTGRGGGQEKGGSEATVGGGR
eukprot:3907473-Rhodomonas_salina.1